MTPDTILYIIGITFALIAIIAVLHIAFGQEVSDSDIIEIAKAYNQTFEIIVNGSFCAIAENGYPEYCLFNNKVFSCYDGNDNSMMKCLEVQQQLKQQFMK